MGTTWICPYYVRDYKDHMSCKCGRIELPSNEATREYMRRYCTTYDWQSCSLACALTKHYNEEEEKEKKDAQHRKEKGGTPRAGGTPPRTQDRGAAARAARLERQDNYRRKMQDMTLIFRVMRACAGT